MGREFTNALASTPLWQFAIAQYSDHKTELLHWQDTKGAHVNDLLAIAFAKQHQLTLADKWWLSEPLSEIRALVLSARRIRKSCAKPNYPQAKRFELELEGLDIQLLSKVCKVGDCNGAIEQYADHLNIEKEELDRLVRALIE